MLAQLFMISSVIAWESFVSDYSADVYTPNGTAIRCDFYSGDVNDYLGACDSRGSNYRGITRLARSNPIYNCFSYAFYKTSTNNNCVMTGNVEAYREDGSYVESEGYTGDRIVYFNKEGHLMHAGVVIARTSYPILDGTDDLANVLVDSKWDWGPLYRHAANNCPYSHVFNASFGSFKFFRLNNNHTHSFEYSVIESNTEEHLVDCFCGLSIKQPHHFYSDNGQYQCIYCDSFLEGGALNEVATVLTKNDETRYTDNKIFLSENDYKYLQEEVNA